jgi:TolB-like protein/tetratricopeptide (TPR) repeat protein
MLQALWPDIVVEESNLAQNIYVVRKALRDAEDEPEYIKTLPKRGYQFVGNVRETDDDPDMDVPRESRNGPVPQSGLPFLRGNRFLILAIVATGIVAAIVVAWREGTPEGNSSSIRSMAVLPFKPLTTDGREESLELGIADTLITKLAGSRDLVVRPISAVRKYTGTQQDPVVAGRELRVDAVLDGSIQRAGSKVRVTVRLIRSVDGRQIWAGSYGGNVSEIFTFQDQIAQQVASSLSLTGTPDSERHRTKRYTNSVDAYEAYVKGRHLSSQRSEHGIRKSIEYFERAIAADPRYAQAYAALAESHVLLSNVSEVPPRESIPEARAAAWQALQLDDSLPEAHTSLAFVREFFEWDLSAAEAEYRRAIDLNPNYVGAHHRYGILLVWAGRFDEAFAELERARSLDAASPIINADIGFAYYCSRKYDAAVDQLQRTAELNPNFPRAHGYLAEAYVQMRRYEEAISEAKTLVTLTGNPSAKTMLSYTYSVSGQKDSARAVLSSVVNATQPPFVQPVALAATHAALGDKDAAFKVLERGYEERASGMLRLGVDPKLDSLRSDPRFTALIKRMGLRSMRQ